MLVMKNYTDGQYIPAVKPEGMTDLDFALVMKTFNGGLVDLVVVRLACQIVEANRTDDVGRFLVYVDS